MANNGIPADVEIQPGNVEDVVVKPGSELDTLLAAFDATDDSGGEEIEAPEVPQTPSIPPVAPTPPAAPAPETDRGLERLAAREKEVRSLEEGFSKREAEFAKRTAEFEKIRTTYVSPEDLKNNPNDVLKKIGLDEDQFMRRVLFNKLPDGHPVKAKLEKEMADYVRDRKYAELEAKFEAKIKAEAEAAEAQKSFQAASERLDKYVDSFKGEANTSLPLLSKIGKENSGVVRELLIEEMLSDASKRYVRGEDGAPLTAEEAAGRIEKLLVKLQPFFSTSANVVPPAKPVARVGANKPVLPAPPESKTPVNELEAMLKRLGV